VLGRRIRFGHDPRAGLKPCEATLEHEECLRKLAALEAALEEAEAAA
jgi:hypothetical protein